MSRGFDGLFVPPFLNDPFAPRRPAAQPAPVRRVPVASSRPKPRAVEQHPPREPVDPRIGEAPAPLTGFDVPLSREEDDEVRQVLGRAEPREPSPERPRRAPRPDPDEQAKDVAREALARAEAKLAYEDELSRARRRFERDAEREVAQQRREIITPFLEVLDDIDRALEAAGDESPAMRKGVELVRERFLAKLRDQGVVPMEVEGEAFDPERHEAMSVVPVTDPALDNRVVAVVRAGYVMGDDVLRPAGVAVGRAR